MSKRNRFTEVLIILALLVFIPAFSADQIKRRGVRWSYVFLTLAILGLIARIAWVAAHK